MKDSVKSDFERIDGIRSIAEMRRQLASLEPKRTRAVIKLGLRKSRCQFTWSFFDSVFSV